jgi:hypothetical protein
MNLINEIKDLAQGTIFTCINVKKNGEQRKYICRMGVRKYLSGGELPYNPAEKNLLPVFDMKKRAYRMIDLTTVKYLRIRKRVLIDKL